MIIHTVEQGSIEWQMLRSGIPTASRFDKIITAEKGARSKSFEDFAHLLVAERILGHPIEIGSTAFMQRGNVVEKSARQFYELQTDIEVKPCGFITLDDESAGASPDGLIGENGILEIKCATPGIHIGYLLDAEGIGYRQQTQGQLWIAEREFVDTVAYHPDLPSTVVRFVRDEKYIAQLAALVRDFSAYIDDCIAQLAKRGFIGHADHPDLKIA
jgi:hypothetical protein